MKNFSMLSSLVEALIAMLSFHTVDAWIGELILFAKVESIHVRVAALHILGKFQRLMNTLFPLGLYEI